VVARSCRLNESAKQGNHLIEHLLVRMAQIDRDDETLRDCIARSGHNLDIAYRRTPPGCLLRSESERTLDDRARGPPRVATHLHGCWPRMTGNTFQGDIQPVSALNAGHHTNGGTGGLQYRALLDMRLEHGVKGSAPRGRNTAV